MKKFVYSLSAIALIVAAVGSVVYWEFYLKERLNTVEVVVAAKHLEPHDKIKAGDLALERRDTSTLPPGYVTDPAKLVDQEAWSVIEPKDVLTTGKLVTGVAPKENQKIYPIPSDWIEAVPGSLRRSDKVDVFALVDPQKIMQSEQQRLLVANQGNQAALPAKPASQDDPILKTVTVAYVKDSSNQEVKPKTDGQSDAGQDRQDLTANPFKIELILTLDQFQAIKDAVEAGNKLLFAY